MKKWLIKNIDNKELFPNFESIVMFVAKRRQMIEFLKLGKLRDDENIEKCIYFDIFGKRKVKIKYIYFFSPLIGSHAEHLHKAETEKLKQITYTYKGKIFDLINYYYGGKLGQPS